MDREGERKRTVAEVSKLIADIETRGHNYPWDEPIGSLLTGWAVSGIEMARSRFRRFGGTAGTRGRDEKGGCQVKKSEAASTDARSEDGPTRMSAEAPVMGVEQRGRVVPVVSVVNSVGRMSRR